MALLLCVHCYEALVLFKVSGFCCVIDNVDSLGLLNILLLPYVMEILQFEICRSSPFTCSNSSQMMWMLDGLLYSSSESGGSCVGQVASFPSWSLSGVVLQYCLPSSPNVTCSKEWAQCSCSHALGSSKFRNFE